MQGGVSNLWAHQNGLKGPFPAVRKRFPSSYKTGYKAPSSRQYRFRGRDPATQRTTQDSFLLPCLHCLVLRSQGEQMTKGHGIGFLLLSFRSHLSLAKPGGCSFPSVSGQTSWEWKQRGLCPKVFRFSFLFLE